jgi:two-component system chemotaxis sensor kinase CheA
MTPPQQSTPCDRLVVVVEDEEDSRALLQEILEGRGYRVVTASDGVEALEVLRRAGHVCLVILDLLMPRLDGFGVLEALAKDPRLAALRVCIATSMPDRAPPGIECLPKPVDMDRLFHVVARSCDAGRDVSR